MAKVLVLMSTYNGEKYLDEQIESIINQSGVEVSILARDDGSTDGTLNILKQWKNRGVLDYYTGENKKPALSFMDLVSHAQGYDFYAFSDQDDIWLPNKLISALEQLEKVAKDKPALYFSKLTYVDENLNVMENQLVSCTYLYSFPQALIKNTAAGCTMVYNESLRKILNLYVPKSISMHDRWLFLVCSAVGGNIIFDKNSYILYRQHSSNVTGDKNYVQLCKSRVKRLFDSSQYIYKHALMLNEGYGNLIEDENGKCIKKVLEYKNGIKYKVNLIKDNRFRIESDKYYEKRVKGFKSYVSCPSNLSFIFKVIMGSL